MPFDRDEFDRAMAEGGPTVDEGEAEAASYDRAEFDRIMFGGGSGELDERAAREPARQHRVRDAEGRALEVELTPERVAAIEAGELALDPGARVWVESQGERYRLAGDDAMAAIAEGAKLLPSRDERSQEHERTLEEAYGDRPGLAFAQGLASGATLGAYDLAARGLGYGEQLREVGERSPTASFAGEIVGAAGPALATGGSSAGARALSVAPSALAARAGAGVTRRLGGGFAARTAGLGVEGAIFGAGSGAAELGRSADPLTIERAASTIGSRALLGGVAGIGVGVLGKAASKGLARAKGVVDDAIKQADEAAPIVGEVEGYMRAREGAFLVANPGSGKGAKASLSKASTRIRDQLNTPDYFSKRPGVISRQLEAERKVLRELVDEGDDKIMTRLAEGDAKLADALEQRIEAAVAKGRKTVDVPKDVRATYRDLAGMAGKKSDKLTVKVADAERVALDLRGGALNADRARAVAELPEMLAHNQRLSAEVDRLADAGRGRGFADAAIDRAGAAVVGATIGGPIGGALGMFAPAVLGRVNQLVSARIGNAVSAAATRSSAAIDAILTKGATAARVATPTASKVLAEVSYSPPRKEIDVGEAPGRGMAGAFKERERELRELTEPTPDGRMRMRRARRVELAARLDGARAADPVLADKLEAIAARRVEFLASKLPKRPDSSALPIGPDNWRPSDFQIRQFARFAAAVEDPGAVEERVSAGTVTPEDAEAYREVYPERFAALQLELMERLPELRHRLEYKKRLGLSILSGIAVDPAMDPKILAVLQSTYPAEDGTDGGTQAPQAKPNFGSLGSLPGAQPTAAQERAG